MYVRMYVCMYVCVCMFVCMYVCMCVCHMYVCFITDILLQTPLTNLKRFGDRVFCAYAPRLWNELPDNIKAADSVQNFKKQLKTLLFRKEFN